MRITQKVRIKEKKYLLAIDDLEIMSLFTSDTFKNVLQGKDTKKKLESVTKLIVSMNQAGMLCACLLYTSRCV